jgi:hypothetical protein
MYSGKIAVPPGGGGIVKLFGQVDQQDVPITGQPSKRKDKNKNKRNKTIKPPNSHANLLKTEENNAFA